MIAVYVGPALKVSAVVRGCAGIADVDVVQRHHFSKLYETGTRKSIIGAPEICAILGSDDCHFHLSGHVLLLVGANRAGKSDPGISVIRFRIRSRGIEHAFDRVRGAGDVAGAFDACERRRHQHHQQRNDADYNEKLYESKSPRAPSAFAGDAAVLRRDKPPGL